MIVASFLAYYPIRSEPHPDSSVGCFTLPLPESTHRQWLRHLRRRSPLCCVRCKRGAFMGKAVKVIGVGDFTPSQVVSNETMSRAIPGWSAELIREKTGILARRFLCEVDPERG